MLEHTFMNSRIFRVSIEILSQGCYEKILKWLLRNTTPHFCVIVFLELLTFITKKG